MPSRYSADYTRTPTNITDEISNVSTARACRWFWFIRKIPTAAPIVLPQPSPLNCLQVTAKLFWMRLTARRIEHFLKPNVEICILLEHMKTTFALFTALTFADGRHSPSKSANPRRISPARTSTARPSSSPITRARSSSSNPTIPTVRFATTNTRPARCRNCKRIWRPKASCGCS